jgi:hypothetical protein
VVRLVYTVVVETSIVASEKHRLHTGCVARILGACSGTICREWEVGSGKRERRGGGGGGGGESRERETREKGRELRWVGAGLARIWQISYV